MNSNSSRIPSLSLREKIVLSNVISYPSNTDVDIAANAGVKHSTYVTIKKRLLQKKYFKRLYLPNFVDLNAEIFSISAREISNFSLQKFDSIVGKEFNFSHNEENILIAGVDANIAIGASVVRNYSDLLRNQWKFDRVAKKLGFLFNFQHHSAIPIHYSTFYRVLDFSRSIQRHLGVEINDPLPIPLFKSSKLPLSITSLGWEIYLAFLNNPGFSPKNIAEMINKPRTTTTRWLRYFLQTGLLTPRIIPNLKKLGYKLCLISYLEVLSSLPEHQKEVTKAIDESISPEFLVQSYKNIIFISMFSSFINVRQAEAKLSEIVKNTNIRFNIVYKFLFSIPNIHFFITLEKALVQITKNFLVPTLVSIE